MTLYDDHFSSNRKQGLFGKDASSVGAIQPRDSMLSYAQEVERLTLAHLSAALNPTSLEVARTLWHRRGDSIQASGEHDDYSEDWGYHISPDLFLVAASLSDYNGHLIQDLISGDSTLRSLILLTHQHGLLADSGIYEIGGRFLDAVVDSPHQNRSYDAKFGALPCLRVDSPSPAKPGLRMIIASALFEETSGIQRTLVDGPARSKQLRPVFASKGYRSDYYARYRQIQARNASIELFAWARNHLADGGWLVVNNVLSPAVYPSKQQRDFLGFSSHTRLHRKLQRGPGGKYETAVHVFHTNAAERPASPLVATVEDYEQENGEWQKRMKRRQWCWRENKLHAQWIET